MDRINAEVLEKHAGIETLAQGKAQDKTHATADRIERLPFTIRIADDEESLLKAVEMRRAAYGRHLPEFAGTMTVESSDRAADTAVLLAESRLDGRALGTMRIQTNVSRPLAVEQSVRLPEWLASARLAEATRLGVAGGTIGRMTKVALCKALFAYCAHQNVDWMVITARSPLDREYEAMLFSDVFGKNEFLPMAHVGGMPHRVLAKPVAVAQQRWAQVGHPLYKFVFETEHPDIDVARRRVSIFL